MAKIFDGKGFIEKTTKEYSVVSVDIDGSPKSFAFYKRIFYTFGVQCDGSLTNILEEGMEVQLCYKTSQCGSKFYIVAVWLGDKPDNLEEDTATLDPIYEKSGLVIDYVDSDNFLVKDKDNVSVVINKQIIFRDGSPLKINDVLAVADKIIFDAIPLKLEHISGALYQATCAWIGSKPRLVDRFDLGCLEDEAEFSLKEMVVGTVAVIPNNAVALADVAFDSTSMKVMLFRSSFNQSCERIEDVVDIGDRLCMSIGWGCIVRGRKWWYALKAFKISEQVNDVNLCEEMSNLVIELDRPDGITGLNTGNDLAEQAVVEFTKDSEILFSTRPLSGVISRLSSARGACITYRDLKIFVHYDNFYMSRRPCTVDEFTSYVAPGNNVVFFYAISTKFSDPEKNHFTHEALLAWVGKNKKPNVTTVAATFRQPDVSLLEKKGTEFYGIVFKYHLPSAAFVNISGTTSFAIMYVHNFVTPPQYPSRGVPGRVLMTNYVEIGDYVEFVLQENPEYPNLLWASEIRPLQSFKKPVLEGHYSDMNVSRGLGEEAVAIENRPLKDTSVDTPIQTAVFNSVQAIRSQSQPVSPASSAPEISFFSKKCLSDRRGYLLNCSGKLRVQTENFVVTVEHIFGSTVVIGSVGYFAQNVSLFSKEMRTFDKRQVRFDAEFAMSPKSNGGFNVVRMWDVSGERPTPERLLLSDLAHSKEETLDCAVGMIKKIPLHDSAIAIVQNVPVLVTLRSLATTEEINPQTSSIETFLSPGDVIYAKMEKLELDGVPYFKSSVCLSLKTLPSVVSRLHNVERNAPRRPSWADVWSVGETYRKERILYLENGYFVKFESSKEKNLQMTLDLFERGNVFVHKQLASPEMLKDHVGEKITFHVARSSKGMFVACAWIGDEPPPALVLKNVLAVPKDLIHSPWRYEAVIASFPLPSYALCYIGHVPVLVLVFGPSDKNVVSHVLLKVGDRLIVTAHEGTVNDTFVVLSYDLQNLRRASDVKVREVYKNLTGNVVSLPKPTGKIKVTGADFVVFFELCHLRRFTKGAKSNKKWLDSVRQKITIGKQVYFSAVKTNSTDFPFRAYEVYFEN